MSTVSTIPEKEQLLKLLFQLGIDDSEELRRIVDEHDSATVLSIPELIPEFQKAGLLQLEQLQSIREFGQAIRIACNSSIDDLGLHADDEESPSNSRSKQAADDEEIRNTWSVSWHIKLLQKIEHLPFIVFEQFQALVMFTHGRQSAAMWAARFLCLLVLGAVAFYFALPNEEQRRAAEAASRFEEQKEAERLLTQRLDVSPILGLVDQGLLGEALEASDDLESKSSFQELDRALLNISLRLANAEALDESEIANQLMEDSRFDSSAWRQVFSVWLVQSSDKSRETMQSFLTASKAGNSVTRFRLKAWLNSREGNSGYALRYLNQVDDLRAEDGDLLFRALASLQAQDHRGALLDLNSMRSQLELKSTAGLSTSSTLDDLVAELTYRQLLDASERLLAFAEKKKPMPELAGKEASMADALLQDAKSKNESPEEASAQIPASNLKD